MDVDDPALLRRALERERRARKDAEAILEVKSRELFEANRGLIRAHDELEKRVEQRTSELVEAKRLAEAASRAKSEFLANMSHEVRTPMAAVLGYADLLLSPGLAQAERDQALQAIRRNGEHLMQIIDDILDLSKIEAGKMDLERIAFEPWSMVLEVVSLLGVRAKEKRVRLEALPVGRVPLVIDGDPTRLRQILLNLVSNAIKFTPTTRRIAVRMSSELDRTGGLPILKFVVEDEGIGMSPEELGQLFRPFQQADTSTTRKYGGSGLGLTISKRIAESMGGDILVESEPGRGSVFTLVVPILAPPGSVQWTEPHQVGRSGVKVEPLLAPGGRQGGRVLLAEDSPDIQKLLLYHLRRAGYDVEVANNGRVAVEMARSGHFDLILMDMQMPELDGYGATSSLRQCGFPGPIVGLTAHAMSDDRERCTRAGCTDYLTKPVSIETLFRTIDHHLHLARIGEAPAPPVAEGLA